MYRVHVYVQNFLSVLTGNLCLIKEMDNMVKLIFAQFTAQSFVYTKVTFLGKYFDYSFF